MKRQLFRQLREAKVGIHLVGAALACALLALPLCALAGALLPRLFPGAARFRFWELWQRLALTLTLVLLFSRTIRWWGGGRRAEPELSRGAGVGWLLLSLAPVPVWGGALWALWAAGRALSLPGWLLPSGVTAGLLLGCVVCSALKAAAPVWLEGRGGRFALAVSGLDSVGKVLVVFSCLFDYFRVPVGEFLPALLLLGRVGLVPAAAGLLWLAHRDAGDLAAARAVLQSGGELVLLAGAEPEEPALSRSDLRVWAGALADAMKGKALLYGGGRVVADYRLYSYGLLRPSPEGDGRRRLAVLLDRGECLFPQRTHRRLQRLSGEGWQLLFVSSTPLARQEPALAHLIRDLPCIPGLGLPAGEQKAWLQSRLRDEHLEERSPTVQLLSDLSDLEGEGPCRAYLRRSLRALVLDFDEVRCFYQLLKLLEFIIHCRALLCAAQGAPAVSGGFPARPSFGSLEECQRGWSRSWNPGPEVAQAVRILERAARPGAAGGGKVNYQRLCAALLCLYNRYVGHGTLVYRVTGELTHALATVADAVIRDFWAQERFPGPELLVPVAPSLATAAGCVTDGDGLYLLSFTRLSPEGGVVWTEYLSYETGLLRYRGAHDQSLQLDYDPEQEVTA